MSDEKKVYCILFPILVAVFVAVWFCLSSRGVRDNGGGADRIRDEIGQSGSHQQNAVEGISRAEGLAETSKIRLDGATGRAENVEAGARDIAELVGECKQILSNVRSRGKVETIKN